MILVELLLTFLKIGTLSFGGGLGMISLIREEVIGHGWLNETELLNIIAVAESTPGPIAVNIATFIGSEQGGFAGALLATIGVVLPSFIIILIIAALIKNFLKYKAVQAFLGGIRPCVIGLIIAVGVILAMSTLFSFSSIGSGFAVDIKGIIILISIISVAVFSTKVIKKKPSPIFMILISAIMGIAVYGI